MIIALDSTYRFDPYPTGVSVYSREILSGLAEAHPEVEFLHACRSHRFLRSLRERLPANCRRRLLLDSGRFSRAELFHGLNQRLPEKRQRRAVATFHDLFVLSGEYSAPDFRLRFAEQARRAVERSDLLIAVSGYTAGQLRDQLNVEPQRIRVIHHGTNLPGTSFGGRGGEAPLARDRVILCVGAIQHRKNIVRLVEAFEQTAAGWRLVLVGSAGYGAAEIFDRIQRSPRRADIDLTGYIPDSQLSELYSRAGIFAFPSLDEGFGMPVLEAMAWGVPVLTSDGSALREVAGGAAKLVDPLDTASITAALTLMVEDDALRARLVELGHRRVQDFTWDAAIRKTWAVYEELLN